jgi:phage terminase large subunit-like protein
MVRDYCDIGLKYAKEVTSGKVLASKFVRAACQRQIDDLKRWKAKDSQYTFDPEKGRRFASSSNSCRISKGR